MLKLFRAEKPVTILIYPYSFFVHGCNCSVVIVTNLKAKCRFLMLVILFIFSGKQNKRNCIFLKDLTCLPIQKFAKNLCWY
jgi:hypothetical protein